jgi:hypothetical protein
MHVREGIDQIDRALGRVGVETIVEERRGPSRDNRGAREAMVPGNRLSLFVEAGRNSVEPIGPVHVVLDVFLAPPDNLDRAVDMLRDLDGANYTIDLESAAKPAADQMIVDHDPVQRQAGGLRCRRPGSRDGLGADPDFAAVLADMDRAVHRLHCRVCEERNLVSRLNLGDGARHGFVAIADTLRNRPRIERRLFELSHDFLCVEPGVRPVVPFDHQSRQPFLCRPHMVGDDGDGVIEPYDLTHAIDSLGRAIIHILHPTAEDG